MAAQMTPRLVFNNGVMSLEVTDGTLAPRLYQLQYRDPPKTDLEQSELTRAIIGAFNAGKIEKAREVRIVIGAGEPR